jgi:hypothetical protein
MSRTTMLAVGVVLVVVGALWFLQGVDVVGGSGMSGKTLWAVVGPVVAVVGLGLLAAGARRRG